MKRVIGTGVLALFLVGAYAHVSISPPSTAPLIKGLPSLAAHKGQGCGLYSHWFASSTVFYQGKIDVVRLRAEARAAGWSPRDGHWVRPMSGFPPAKAYLVIRGSGAEVRVTVGTKVSKLFGADL